MRLMLLLYLDDFFDRLANDPIARTSAVIILALVNHEAEPWERVHLN
jgi:hypothetical protein